MVDVRLKIEDFMYQLRGVDSYLSSNSDSLRQGGRGSNQCSKRLTGCRVDWIREVETGGS